MVVYLYNYTYTTWRQVLGDDVVNFFEGVASVPRGLYRFGDYLGRISGLRDWQEGSVLRTLPDFEDFKPYQEEALWETKYTYKIIKFIIVNEEARKIFYNSAKKYILNNKAKLLGSSLTGFSISKFSKVPLVIPSLSKTGDLMFNMHQVDSFAKSIIRGE